MPDPPLTFRNSYPQVLLPPGPLRRLPAVTGRAPVVHPPPPTGSPFGLLILAGSMALIIMTGWVGVVLVAVLLVVLWSLGYCSPQPRRPRAQAKVTRDDRVQQAMLLLPDGDARVGRFDRHLTQLASSQVKGLLVCRLGPHLEPLCQLNRYPDLVMVTETGILVAVEVDEPWYWDGQQRVLSHDAEADEACTQELLAKGLVMVRLAEQQVAEHPVDCIQLLQAVTDRVRSGMTPRADLK